MYVLYCTNCTLHYTLANCRLESLVEEVSSHTHDPTPRPSLAAPPIGGAQTGLLARPTAEMHKAPLIARVHMRMGIWRWTVTEVMLAPSDTIQHCMGSIQGSPLDSWRRFDNGNDDDDDIDDIT